MTIDWTRDECILALDAYMSIRGDWKHITPKDPIIIVTSEEITRLCNHRTVGSVKAKFENFRSMDPLYKPKGGAKPEGGEGKKALSKAGYAAIRVWAEFSEDPERLAREARAIRETLEFHRRLREGGPKEGYFDLSGTEVEYYEAQISMINRMVKGKNVRGYDVEAIEARRIGQETFRARVISNFGERCCITGEGNAMLLRAGHIKPWNVCDEWEKVDAGNGLCLEPMFDLAFDKGLIQVDEDMRVALSTKLVKVAEEETFDKVFRPYSGRRIREPKEHQIDQKYLAYHREKVFQEEIWDK